MKHEHHNHCEHESVKFCSRCDVVYCLGCKQEWGICRQTHYQWTYTYPQWTTATDPNWTTTSGTADVATDCTHVHA